MDVSKGFRRSWIVVIGHEVAINRAFMKQCLLPVLFVEMFFRATASCSAI